MWVGFDDYSELGLEGARSALPIWTEFMMKAARYKQYGDVKPFAPPSGVVRVGVDPQTGLLAGPYCTGIVSYFIDGTQPVSQCPPPEPQEIEVSFTEDGGATQRAASDQAVPRQPRITQPQVLQAPVPLTSTEQPLVIQPKVFQPLVEQPPVQPAPPPQPPSAQPPAQRPPQSPQVRWPWPN